MTDQPKPDPKADPIDAAIAAAAEPIAVQMITLPVTIASTGRPFQVSLPVDTTDAELVEVTGWMLTALSNHFRAERAKTAGGRIIVPGPGRAAHLTPPELAATLKRKHG